jgi:tetratricopeptide (TPR) repeat protein
LTKAFPHFLFRTNVASLPLMRVLLPILLIWTALALRLPAQSAALRAEARQLSEEAETLLRDGRPRDAVQKFTRAAALDPKNTPLRLQLARAHYFDQNYKASMKISGPLMQLKKPSMEAFQLYGNCQQELGKDYDALLTYREGLSRFPRAGALYMEMGILEFARQRDSVALAYWEAGIRAQPAFSANYYLAAKAQFQRGDLAWAFLYAETFINLDRTGDRVREMSILLYQAFLNARDYDYQGEFHWRFVPEERPEWHFPLHTLLAESFQSTHPDTAWTPDIATLGEARRFAAFFVQSRLPDNPAAALLKWQQRIAAQGHFEAYNYWLFYDARPEDFMLWYDTNKAAYEAFEAWFLRMPFPKHLKRPVVRD